MINAVVFDMYETLVSMFRCPAYKGRNIARDIGLEEPVFRQIWDPSDDPRTLGKMSFEQVIRNILEVNGLFSEELLKEIVRKREAAQEKYFNFLHPEILPMLERLKGMGLKIALISNCYLDERDVIRKSVLWKYFDAACMSCEEEIKKPDREIFERCLKRLGIPAEECLYIGDGENGELEAAEAAGMKAAQAVWYFMDGLTQQEGRKAGFIKLESPLDVVTAAESL